MTKSALLLALLTSVCSWAQEVPVPEMPLPPVAPPAEDPAIPDDGVRVAILGYHDLAEDLPETAMRIRTSKFRKQMETIRQSGIKVLTLDEFTAWKKGDAKIPENSILITFDDGWKSVYTDAYPILKEFGFPFTIFLYKNYVDGGGKALTEGGLRVGYSWGGGKYDVAAFGRNITNQVRVTGAIDFNNLTGFINDPRTYGVQFKATF